MKTIAFVNHKGGVGKTTVSLQFAEGLARRGKSVLVVDLDQQMNASQYSGYPDTKNMESAYDLLVEGIDAIRAIRPAPYGLIIPGDALLGDDAAIEISHLDTPVLMLKDSLESVESLDIDYCIIDCPPNLGFVTRNAMAASDEIIVVVRPDKFSLNGYASIQATVQRITGNKHLNPNLKVAGILFNAFDWNRRLTRHYLHELPKIAIENGTRLFETRIRLCESLPQVVSLEKSEKPQSIFDYAPASNAAKDFEAFVSEYLALELEEGSDNEERRAA